MSGVSVSAPSADELTLASKKIDGAVLEIELCIPELNCGSCIGKIEKALSSLESVQQVRANLTKKRVRIRWYSDDSPTELLNAISSLGFSASLIDSSEHSQSEIKPYLRALAVAGFAASNVMLMSVAVWSGADYSTRQLFHWISAAIALPAIAYSGTIFFKPAWLALRSGRTNMDVPITVGIILSVLLGLYDTINQNDRVYFEAATMLVFFLLIGRTLDKLMRARAASSIDGLRALEPPGAYVLTKSGGLEYKATKDLIAGDTIVVNAGERIPVDGVVASGESTIDTAIVDGESRPKNCQPGLSVYGGTLNITAELTIRVSENRENSFLAKMHRLVQFAHNSKGKYTQVADKAAQWYAPLVHTAAALAFILWIYLTGDVHKSLTIAISVLIITCPCALALAVPMVHVMAGNQLLKRGVIMKDGASLEKLGEVSAIVLDKTGTLTTEVSVLNATTTYTDTQLGLTAILAQSSEHPYAKALMQLINDTNTHYVHPEHKVHDIPGLGLETTFNSQTIRLGRREWAAYSEPNPISCNNSETSETVLGRNGKLIAVFHFSEELRLGAISAIKRLRNYSLDIAIVSGDQAEAVSRVADQLAISVRLAKAMPQEKVEFIQKMAECESVLMVGDGINDCGAMAAARVAMAPGTAANVGRNLADFIFIKKNMNAVPDAIEIAHKARKLIKQNITMSVIYNMVFLPVAFVGWVTPLMAAVAMSLSSILVVANAMRLNRIGSHLALDYPVTQLKSISGNHIRRAL